MKSVLLCLLFIIYFVNCDLILFIVLTEADDVSSSPDSTPKKDKPAKVEVAKVARPQGRLGWPLISAHLFLNLSSLLTTPLFLTDTRKERGGKV